ncbi:MAG: putative toxin-antitoxin system toxin component, PIN family [Chloroflexi bacterium]|nr:MAG: putative toxin-antitoxin system toxin component, PIN family [Chloroflexota bacterium]
MRVVLDTDVFISALRSEKGASYQILRLVGKGFFHTYLSVSLLLEYEAVANRYLDELAVDEGSLNGLLDYLCQVARPQEIHFRWRPAVRDPGDEMVLELAVAGNCDAIITFNKRDYRGAERFGVRILSPAEFLRELGLAR